MRYNSNMRYWRCSPELREAERMRNHGGKSTAIFAAAAIAWIGVLFFFSGQVGEDSSALSGGVTQLLFGWLLDWGMDFDLLHHCVRKAAHFGIFAVEGCLMGMALLNGLKRRTAVLLTGVGCALLSVLNELHQMQAAGRVCSVADMAIDFCGALTGLAAAAAILHAFSAFRRRMAKKYDYDR